MTQNFIQPKGTLKPQIGIEDLQKQYAQAFLNNQTQNAQNNNADDLRTTVADLIKNKLLNTVEMPKYTTLGDVLGAGKGDKLGAFADFLNNPQTMRTIGNLLPKYGYNPKTGKIGNVMEDTARRRELQFEADRQKALAEQKEQNDLAQAMANAYNQRDMSEEQNKSRRELAELEMQWKAEQNALDREMRRQENAENRAQRLELARMIHGNGGGIATGGAAGINDLKMTAAERKSYTEGKTTLANIDAGLRALEKNPKAYTFAKGILPTDITNRIDPEGVATRTQIDNITAVYRKWLTGAQMSDKERKAYERFLPAPTDNYNIVKAKLNGMKGAIERSNDAILSNYGISSESMNTPSLNVDRNALEAEMKRRGLK